MREERREKRAFIARKCSATIELTQQAEQPSDLYDRGCGHLSKPRRLRALTIGPVFTRDRRHKRPYRPRRACTLHLSPVWNVAMMRDGRREQLKISERAITSAARSPSIRVGKTRQYHAITDKPCLHLGAPLLRLRSPTSAIAFGKRDDRGGSAARSTAHLASSGWHRHIDFDVCSERYCSRIAWRSRSSNRSAPLLSFEVTSDEAAQDCLSTTHQLLTVHYGCCSCLSVFSFSSHNDEWLKLGRFRPTFAMCFRVQARRRQ